MVATSNTNNHYIYDDKRVWVFPFCKIIMYTYISFKLGKKPFFCQPGTT